MTRPKHKKSGVEEQPTLQMLAEYLQDIFVLQIHTSNWQPCIRNRDEGANVQSFSMSELDYVLHKVER